MAKYRISDIENFVSTCGSRTIIEASRQLGISQPALSESIKRLEQDLGYVLFYRSRTGIQLTPNGKSFLDKATHVIEALADLDESKNQNHFFSRQTITIGCHSTVAQYSMPKTLNFIRKTAPDYKIKLEHQLSRHIQIEVQRGNIDIGVIINPAEVPDLVIKKIGKDVVSVWAGKKNFDKTTIICNPALIQTQHILRQWKNKPFKMIETDSLELIGRLVQADLGYGIIPRRAVELLGLNLTEVDSLPTYQDHISIVHRPEFGLNRSENLVREAIKASL